MDGEKLLIVKDFINDKLSKQKYLNCCNLFNNKYSNELLINLQDVAEWSFQENINNEFSSLGLYLSAHPLDCYSNILSKMNVKSSIEISKQPEKYIKKTVKLCGLIFKIQKRHSPRGRWVSIQLNDLNGFLLAFLTTEPLLPLSRSASTDS